MKNEISNMKKVIKSISLSSPVNYENSCTPIWHIVIGEPINGVDAPIKIVKLKKGGYRIYLGTENMGIDGIIDTFSVSSIVWDVIKE